MAIAVRGSAWDPFTTLVRQFDADIAAFDAVARRSYGEPRRPATGFAPAADVTRDGQDLVVTLELPGVDVEDVEVEVAEGRLVITGTRARRSESDAAGSLVREIRSGAFRREFGLPRGVTADRVEADYDRGLLTVRVREVVRPAVQPTRVKVRSARPRAQADAPPVTDAAGADAPPVTAAGAGAPPATDSPEAGAVEQPAAK